MNYRKHYDLLIQNGRNRSILKSAYSETHHIIPRCMGGSDNPDNLVELFPEEHLVAHLLLVKIHPEVPHLIYAASLMVNTNVRTNKQYRWVKERHWIVTSERMKINNPMFRPEIVEKIRIKLRKPKSEQGRKNIAAANKLIDKNGDKNSFYGKTHTVESMEKMVSSRITNNGCYHPKGNVTAKTFKFTSPTGEEFMVFNSANKFCTEKNISFRIIKNCNGLPYIMNKTAKKHPTTINSQGWSVTEVK